jgi:hypothetical protein
MPVQDGRPIIFAETAAEPAQPSKRLQSTLLLDQWPEGYERGGYRLDGADIVLFAPGRPDMRLANAL